MIFTVITFMENFAWYTRDNTDESVVPKKKSINQIKYDAVE